MALLYRIFFWFCRKHCRCWNFHPHILAFFSLVSFKFFSRLDVFQCFHQRARSGVAERGVWHAIFEELLYKKQESSNKTMKKGFSITSQCIYLALVLYASNLDYRIHGLFTFVFLGAWLTISNHFYSRSDKAITFFKFRLPLMNMFHRLWPRLISLPGKMTFSRPLINDSEYIIYLCHVINIPNYSDVFG